MQRLSRAVIRQAARRWKSPFARSGAFVSSRHSYYHSDLHQYGVVPSYSAPTLRATTILAVRKAGDVTIVGDGQCTMGESVIAKTNAKKIRVLDDSAGIVCGIAGGVADAFTLIDLVEAKIREHPNQLLRACIETAKLWRTDKMLRQLQARLLLADCDSIIELGGNGEVLLDENGVSSIGSGSVFAGAAALALKQNTDYDSTTIAIKAMEIAAERCAYTNSNFVVQPVVQGVTQPQRLLRGRLVLEGESSQYSPFDEEAPTPSPTRSTSTKQPVDKPLQVTSATKPVKDAWAVRSDSHSLADGWESRILPLRPIKRKSRDQVLDGTDTGAVKGSLFPQAHTGRRIVKYFNGMVQL